MAKKEKGMTDKALYNRNLVQSVRGAMLRGELTLAEARKKLQPAIDDMNKRSQELSKKYGIKFKPIKFTNLMR